MLPLLVQIHRLAPNEAHYNIRDTSLPRHEACLHSCRISTTQRPPLTLYTTAMKLCPASMQLRSCCTIAPMTAPAISLFSVTTSMGPLERFSDFNRSTSFGFKVDKTSGTVETNTTCSTKLLQSNTGGSPWMPSPNFVGGVGLSDPVMVCSNLIVNRDLSK